MIGVADLLIEFGLDEPLPLLFLSFDQLRGSTPQLIHTHVLVHTLLLLSTKADHRSMSLISEGDSPQPASTDSTRSDRAE